MHSREWAWQHVATRCKNRLPQRSGLLIVTFLAVLVLSGLLLLLAATLVLDSNTFSWFKVCSEQPLACKWTMEQVLDVLGTSAVCSGKCPTLLGPRSTAQIL